MIAQRRSIAATILQNIRVAQRRFYGLQTTQNVSDLFDVDQIRPRKRRFRRERGLLRKLCVALLERVDATFCVNHRLGAGEIGMASRASVDSHGLLGRTGLDDIAARTSDGGFIVIRMDVALH